MNTLRVCVINLLSLHNSLAVGPACLDLPSSSRPRTATVFLRLPPKFCLTFRSRGNLLFICFIILTHEFAKENRGDCSLLVEIFKCPWCLEQDREMAAKHTSYHAKHNHLKQVQQIKNNTSRFRTPRKRAYRNILSRYGSNGSDASILHSLICLGYPYLSFGVPPCIPSARNVDRGTRTSGFGSL